jgi:hypothetical protein
MVRSPLILSKAIFQPPALHSVEGVMRKVQKVVSDLPQNFPQKRLDRAELRQTSLE